MTKEKWTWSTDKEDPELYKNGVTVAWVDGRLTAIQKFVEVLSERINRKCDFAYTAGRAHIDVFPDVVDKAKDALADDEFMRQFLVPYSEEAYDDGTYFRVLT